ncbi:MAG TPA: hypothetical protein VFG72_13530 [Marmoricola sp.]|nr:hypothetical protein [Marmoricola sp.]
MFGKRQEPGSPLERALDAAAGLKAGSWASVEALSMLSLEAKGRPESRALHSSALDAAAGLSPGSWESIRALAWLAHAGRELGLDE